MILQLLQLEFVKLLLGKNPESSLEAPFWNKSRLVVPSVEISIELNSGLHARPNLIWGISNGIHAFHCVFLHPKISQQYRFRPVSAHNKLQNAHTLIKWKVLLKILEIWWLWAAQGPDNPPNFAPRVFCFRGSSDDPIRWSIPSYSHQFCTTPQPPALAWNSARNVLSFGWLFIYSGGFLSCL